MTIYVLGAWKESLLVRCDKEKHDEILTEPYTNPADMSGRIMKGWVLVDPKGIEFEEYLISSRWHIRSKETDKFLLLTVSLKVSPYGFLLVVVISFFEITLAVISKNNDH